MTKIALGSLLLIAGLVLSAGGAAAHVTQYFGGYAVKIGWDQEPSESSVYNHVTMQVWDNATGNVITGITPDELNLTVTYTNQTKTLDYEESDDTPGLYSAPIVPSQPGLYVIHAEGKINGTPVSADFNIEDVQDIGDSTFPAKTDTTSQDVAQLKSDVQTLKTEVATLQAKVGTQASTPATVISSTPASSTPAKGIAFVGVGALLGGVAGAALVLGVRRKR